MDRYPIASVINLYMSIVEAGNGVTGQTPSIAIRRVSDNAFYDDSLASGSRFTASPTTNTMAELDSVNSQGLYGYDFDHSEDTTCSEMFDVKMTNPGATPRLEYLQIAFGRMMTASSPDKCLLHGVVIKPNGKPAVNDTVRLSIVPNTILPTGVKPAVTVDRVDTFTDKNGEFSMDIIRGLIVRLQIPSVGYDKKIVIPDSTSANFADL